jgi:hypothetical protein
VERAEWFEVVCFEGSTTLTCCVLLSAQEVMLVLRVALLCSSDLPVDRPTMRDVVQMLADVKPKRKGSSLGDSRELAELVGLKDEELHQVLVCV